MLLFFALAHAAFGGFKKNLKTAHPLFWFCTCFVVVFNNSDTNRRKPFFIMRISSDFHFCLNCLGFYRVKFDQSLFGLIAFFSFFNQNVTYQSYSISNVLCVCLSAAMLWQGGFNLSFYRLDDRSVPQKRRLGDQSSKPCPYITFRSFLFLSLSVFLESSLIESSSAS